MTVIHTRRDIPYLPLPNITEIVLDDRLAPGLLTAGYSDYRVEPHSDPGMDLVAAHAASATIFPRRRTGWRPTLASPGGLARPCASKARFRMLIAAL